jgi:hypothetical protein
MHLRQPIWIGYFNQSGFTLFPPAFGTYMYFKNSLIIHDENTKKNHKRVVSLYVIKISLDLHKL